MGPAQAIRTGLAKSFQFYGRADRSEFWGFAALWLPIAALGFVILDTALSAAAFTKDNILGAFFLRVFICLPLLAAAARLVIDAGFSATWIGCSFSALVFAISLTDMVHWAPPDIDTAGMRPVAATLFSISLAVLAYILTRKSALPPHSTKVQP